MDLRGIIGVVGAPALPSRLSPPFPRREVTSHFYPSGQHRFRNTTSFERYQPRSPSNNRLGMSVEKYLR
jgi:hypothetical protein